jgi:acetaldehyde dehydrogenase (acetylating)
VVRDWREGCERCKEILRYGGMGHTMSIHSQNDQVILEFGLKKPAFRICVNTPTPLGSIGLTTGLDPAMTLGCGGYGGNITSDNISPKHLLNIKRLAYEITPAASRSAREPAAQLAATAASPSSVSGPARVPAAGINAQVLSRRIDEFLGSRGYRGEEVRLTASAEATAVKKPDATHVPDTTHVKEETPLEFVCEEDVRQAIQAGRKLLISERAIVTPAARDLAEEHRIITFPTWRN